MTPPDGTLLSPAVFRALSSPTRAAILRALAERPHTPSELARRVGVSDPTVRNHLASLTRAGLAARREDGRVWAYHELTPRARRLFSGGVRGPLLATLAGVGLAGAGAGLLALWRAHLPGPPAPTLPRTFRAPVTPAVDPWESWLPWLQGGGIALVAAGALVVLAGLAWAWWVRRARVRA